MCISVPEDCFDLDKQCKLRSSASSLLAKVSIGETGAKWYTGQNEFSNNGAI